MREDVDTYVRICLVCQQDKIEQEHPHGLLQPLPIPERIWDSVSSILSCIEVLKRVRVET